MNADVRTERLNRLFLAVLLPRNALALGRTEDDVLAILRTVEAHLAADGVFALDARVEAPRAEGEAGARVNVVPHLRERREGQWALHRLELAGLTAAHLDELLQQVGLEARERYQDFRGTPIDDEAELQVVVGGAASGPRAG